MSDFPTIRCAAPASFWLVAAGALTACVSSAGAQGPLRQIESRADGQVSFSFAARSDVCGYGGSTIRIGGAGPFDRGTITYSSGGGWGGPCESGPVRVLLTRAEGVTTGARVGVGDGPLPPGATDLGLVPAGQAGAYLFELAAKTDGRAARELLLAAVLADSTDAARALLRIGGDRSLVTSLRESAIGWLGREAELSAPAARGEVVAALVRLARDDGEVLSLRRRATAALGRAGSDGVNALVGLADGPEALIPRAAVDALGDSGDPQARAYLRRAARDTDRTPVVRAEILKSLAGRDAAPSDYALLRELYETTLEGGSRSTIIDAAGQAGGSENLRWLLRLARDENARTDDRRRAVRGAVQAGATSADLIGLFDAAASRQVKETLVDQLVRLGDRAAIDKVTRIATSDTDPNVRRSAVRRLAQTGDPEATEALKAIIEP